MGTVSFSGVQARVLFGVSAMERIEESIGSMDTLRRIMSERDGERLPRAMLAMYDAMTACAGELEPHEPFAVEFVRHVFADEQYRTAMPMEYRAAVNGLMLEMRDGMRMRHMDGGKKPDRYTQMVQQRMAKRKGEKSEGVDSILMYHRALVAGISYTEARTMHPGLINDLYTMGVKHSVQMSPLSAIGSATKNRTRKG